MNRDIHETNLGRLMAEMDAFCTPNGNAPDEGIRSCASSVAKNVFLSHSATAEKFAGICASNRIFSLEALCVQRGTRPDPASVEVQLGTANCVFLYAAPFRFSRTSCGFLFNSSMEVHYGVRGVATLSVISIIDGLFFEITDGRHGA